MKKTHKDNISKRKKKYREEHKEEFAKRGKLYRETHAEELNKYFETYRKENRDKLLNKTKYYNSRICIDPIKGDECTTNALCHRKNRNKELYKDVIPSACII